ncbi:MAG: nuclear transport factor 2 family protein [Candidatus Abyssobacteria bacterium SURF_17]|jgi:ketosteroid isomerase-like protein|uniref:Nuclear transport factor 2 family protein n=1 Tax=Candidatus Abyssobacteria bacterium SURF_17 TaxID=2093361 RepID=A0A419EN85_9BACT|nr:MAG: nuclear transport factor 2 family protein [Candidatus Abyssubacteria bacterium SURF_17]
MPEPLVVQLAKQLRDAYNSYLADQPQTLGLFTDDVVYRDPRFPAFRGKEALKGYLKQLAGENQALQVKWEFVTIIAEGQQAAVEWVVKTALDVGGKRFEFPGAAFFKMREGKISSYCGYWDTGILQQLSTE